MKNPTTTEELLGQGGDTAKAEKDLAFSQRVADIRETFGTPHGRRTLLAIIENTFQYDTPMTGNSATYHNLGAMDYGRAIMDVVAVADPDTFLWIYAQRATFLGDKYTDKIKGEGEG